MATTRYAVTMIKPDGTETLMFCATSPRKASSLAKWTAGNFKTVSRVMQGGPGGIEVARFGEEA